MQKHPRIPSWTSILIILLLAVIYIVFPEESGWNGSSRSGGGDRVAIPAFATSTAHIVRVVDGDTVDIAIDTNTVRTRLIGIDAPETVDPSRPVECFGREASEYAKRMLPKGSEVIVATDDSQGMYDKYDRMLVYLFFRSGENFNRQMIAEGYAFEYTYRTPYRFRDEFRTAEQNAEHEKKGLWADGVCVSATTYKGSPM